MNTSRPNSVKLAIGCLASSFVISLVQTLVRADFRPSGFAFEMFGFFIALFLVFMIYRRKNWARWILAGCAVVWFASLALHFRFVAELTIVRDFLLVAQLILWAVAVFLLFVPAANDWFRTHDESA
jgi:peptidoglycan/LPS O-acetylase OafA/YrhL